MRNYERVIRDMSEDFIKYCSFTPNHLEILDDIIELENLDLASKKELAQLWVKLNAESEILTIN